jgi:hypothetical protein
MTTDTQSGLLSAATDDRHVVVVGRAGGEVAHLSVNGATTGERVAPHSAWRLVAFRAQVRRGGVSLPRSRVISNGTGRLSEPRKTPAGAYSLVGSSSS